VGTGQRANSRYCWGEEDNGVSVLTQISDGALFTSLTLDKLTSIAVLYRTDKNYQLPLVLQMQMLTSTLVNHNGVSGWGQKRSLMDDKEGDGAINQIKFGLQYLG
jgi:hypothetical protein